MTTFVDEHYTKALAEYFNDVGYSYDSLGIKAGQWNAQKADEALTVEGFSSPEEHLVEYGRRPEIVDKLFAEQGYEDGYVKGLVAYYNDLGYTYEPLGIGEGEWTSTNIVDAIQNSGEGVQSHFLKYARRPEILQKVNQENPVSDEYELFVDEPQDIAQGQNLQITGSVTNGLDEYLGETLVFSAEGSVGSTVYESTELIPFPVQPGASEDFAWHLTTDDFAPGTYDLFVEYGDDQEEFTFNVQELSETVALQGVSDGAGDVMIAEAV